MPIVSTGQITITDMMDGLNARLSRDSFALPCNSAGVVSSYAGCSTTMSVFLGATNDSANWTFSATPGAGVSGSLSGSTYTVAEVTGESGSVVLTASRVGFASLTSTFTITKVKDGAPGPAVLLTSSRPASFTSTDGVLDPGQQDIEFTAATQGLTGATFSWGQVGLGSAPSESTTNKLVVTAANFGNSKSAIVAVTVNGVIEDKMTIVRLEKSTAQAGATVGADGSNLKTGTGVNMVFNGDYTDGTAGTYGGFYTSSTPSLIGHNLESHTLQGEGTAYVYLNGTPAANSVFDADVFNGAPGKNFPVQAGKKYEAYAWLNSHRCAGVISVVFFNSSGGQISQVQGNTVNFQSGISTLADLRQSWGIFTAPIGAVSAKVIVRATATGAATPYLFFSRVYFGEAGAAQNESSPWSPGRGIAQITSSNASTYIANAALGRAQIGLAAIGQANIDVAAVGTAQIQELSVSTLKIADFAVTIPVAASGVSDFSVSQGNFTGDVISVSMNSMGAPVLISIFCPDAVSGQYGAGMFRIFRDGVQIAEKVFVESGQVFASAPVGTVTYSLRIKRNYSGPHPPATISVVAYRK